MKPWKRLQVEETAKKIAVQVRVEATVVLRVFFLSSLLLFAIREREKERDPSLDSLTFLFSLSTKSLLDDCRKKTYKV
jgi:hypothetical protein